MFDHFYDMRLNLFSSEEDEKQKNSASSHMRSFKIDPQWTHLHELLHGNSKSSHCFVRAKIFAIANSTISKWLGWGLMLAKTLTVILTVCVQKFRFAFPQLYLFSEAQWEPHLLIASHFRLSLLHPPQPPLLPSSPKARESGHQPRELLRDWASDNQPVRTHIWEPELGQILRQFESLDDLNLFDIQKSEVGTCAWRRLWERFLLGSFWSIISRAFRFLLHCDRIIKANQGRASTLDDKLLRLCELGCDFSRPTEACKVWRMWLAFELFDGKGRTHE